MQSALESILTGTGKLQAAFCCNSHPYKVFSPSLERKLR